MTAGEVRQVRFHALRCAQVRLPSVTSVTRMTDTTGQNRTSHRSAAARVSTGRCAASDGCPTLRRMDIDTATELLTLDEVCAAGKLTKGGFRNLRQQGLTPPAYRIGRRLWFRREDVESWLDLRMRAA